MRIGEVAQAAGVSTRTVRHYHHVGILPEPPRTHGGYRDYALRDLIRLCHARQLIEIGLSLGEVRDALADSEGHDLTEVVEAMDAELAAQQEAIAGRRRRLAALRERVREGHLGIDDLPEPELVEFFTRVEAAGATGPTVRLDRDVLAVVSGADASRWVRPMLPLMDDPDYTRRVARIYQAFDELADAAPDDPRVTACVRLVLEVIPPESRQQLATYDLAELADEAVIEAMYDELSPAQAAAARRVLELMTSTTNPTTQEDAG